MQKSHGPLTTIYIYVKLGNVRMTLLFQMKHTYVCIVRTETEMPRRIASSSRPSPRPSLIDRSSSTVSLSRETYARDKSKTIDRFNSLWRTVSSVFVSRNTVTRICARIRKSDNKANLTCLLDARIFFQNLVKIKFYTFRSLSPFLLFFSGIITRFFFFYHCCFLLYISIICAECVTYAQ